VKYETLDVTITDAVMTVVLNRPEKKNAMGPTTLSELHSVLDDNDRSKDVRVLILTGSGDSFTAGADIKTLAVNRADDPTLYYQEYKYMLSLQEKLRLFPKATIAAVNGWCLGWGMWIVSVCDFAIASKKAKLGHPQVGMGAMPSGGAIKGNLDLLPHRDALYYLLTGEMLSPEVAERLRLVNYVVEHDDLMPQAMELAGKLKDKDPVVVAAIKHAFWREKYLSYTDGLDLEYMQATEALRHQGEFYPAGFKDFREEHS